MPYSAEHKQRSREKILESAITLFTRQGFEKTSIDQVMHEAELTRGAFYTHFTSKSDLYQQAILNGAGNSILLKQKPDHCSEQDWVRTLIKWYLSDDHVKQKSGACPLAFLVNDVAINEPEVRHTYTRVFQEMNKLIKRSLQRFSNSTEQEIFAATALMIGAVAIGRSLDCQTTLNKLLRSSEAVAQQLLQTDGAKSG
ncbi:MAG: TetR/AcrR family transcriptional regulator [Thioalkalispiraceae bacterium]|jgi:AcrR family transcriptional regulator